MCERLLERQCELRMPRGERPVQRRLARRRDVHVGQGFVRRRRRVGRECEQRTGRDVLGPREGAVDALVTEHRGPVAEDRGVGVHRLHGRGHAQPRHPLGRAGSRVFEVLDAVPARAGAVRLRRVLEGVQGDVAREVADRVQRHLQSRGVRCGDDGRHVGERPDRLGVRPVGIRMPHRGRARIDDAVDHELDAHDPQPGRSHRLGELDGARDLREVRRVVAGVLDEPVRRDPEREPPAAPLGGSLERGESEFVERHVDRPGHAGRRVRGEGALDRRVAVGVVGLRRQERPGVDLGRGLVQHAVGLAVGVAPDAAAEGVGSVARDPDLGEGGGVEPARVVVVGIEVHRHVGHRRVDHGSGRDAAGHRVEEPAAAEQPHGVRLVRTRRTQALLDLVQRARVGEPDAAERLAHHHEVGVRVGEAGEQQAAAELDGGGIRSRRRRRSSRIAGEHDRLAVDDERLGPGLRARGEDAPSGVDRRGHAGTSLCPEPRRGPLNEYRSLLCLMEDGCQGPE